MKYITKGSVADTLGWTEQDIKWLKYQLGQFRTDHNMNNTPSVLKTIAQMSEYSQEEIRSM